MKKTAFFIILVTLLLALSACGGKETPPPADNTPLTRAADPTTAPPTTAATATTAAAPAPAVDMEAIYSGSGDAALVSAFGPAEKAEFIAEAEADGYTVTFEPDGGVRMESAEDGEVIVQKPDGSWIVETEDGGQLSYGNTGWPESDLADRVPVPPFEIAYPYESPSELTVTFTNATLDDLRAYVEEVKAAGFVKNAETEDMEVMGMVIYTYTAQNAEGYTVSVFSAGGATGLSVAK